MTAFRLSDLVADKSEVGNDLVFEGSWNAYCLAKSLDWFLFIREG
jgi:hypothetical protein